MASKLSEHSIKDHLNEQPALVGQELALEPGSPFQPIMDEFRRFSDLLDQTERLLDRLVAASAGV